MRKGSAIYVLRCLYNGTEVSVFVSATLSYLKDGGAQWVNSQEEYSGKTARWRRDPGGWTTHHHKPEDDWAWATIARARLIAPPPALLPSHPTPGPVGR